MVSFGHERDANGAPVPRRRPEEGNPAAKISKIVTNFIRRLVKMKHTMKKLLCMALAIMLLVSAVPVFAAADDGFSVEFIVTDTLGNTLATANPTETAGSRYTAQNYLDTYYGAWSSNYTVNRVWIKNSDTGDKGADTTLSREITGTCKLVIKLEHKPVNLYLKIMKGDKLVETVTKSVDYGSTVNLTDALAVEAGYSGFDARVTSGSLQEGESFTATSDREVFIYLVTSTPDNSGSGSDDNTTATTSKSVTLNIVNVSGGSVVWTDTREISDDTTTVKNLLYYWYGNKSNSWQNSYECTKAWSKAQQKDVGYEGTIAAGDTVTVVLTPKSSGGSTVTPPTSTTSGDLSLVITANGAEVVKKTIQNFTKDTVSNLIKKNLDADWTSKYGFNEVAINGVTYYRSDLEVKAADKTVNISLSRKYSKDNSNKVYLHVYLNGDASTIALTKDITGTYLMDDWSTDTTEILKYLKNNYYTAKDTSEAITIDGLYTNTNTNGAFPGNYYADNKVSRLDNIKDALEDGYVHISVMLKNAKAKTSATADTSNPKTGDTIFVPVMVMGLTASALAAAYVIGKKRFAR